MDAQHTSYPSRFGDGHTPFSIIFFIPWKTPPYPDLYNSYSNLSQVRHVFANIDGKNFNFRSYKAFAKQGMAKNMKPSTTLRILGQKLTIHPGMDVISTYVSHMLETPWKINGWNLQITHEKKGEQSSKPPWLWSMLIFQDVHLKCQHFVKWSDATSQLVGIIQNINTVAIQFLARCMDTPPIGG